MKEGTPLFIIEPEPYKVKLEQAEGAAGRRQGGAEVCRGRIQAAGGTDRQAGLDPGALRQVAGPARRRPRQPATGGGQYPAGRDQLRLHQRQGAVRRRRHRAPGLDRRHGRRHHADAARHHRPARSDLRELQSGRARRAERPRGDPALGLTPEDLKKVPVEVGLQTDDGYPQQGHARLRGAERRSLDRHARSCAAFSRTRSGCCCPAISCACACRSGSTRMRCWCRTRRSERPGRPLPAGRQQGQRGRAAQGRDRSARRRHAGDREGHHARTTASSSTASCARSRARRSIRRCRRRLRRRQALPPQSSGLAA